MLGVQCHKRTKMSQIRLENDSFKKRKERQLCQF